MFLFSKNHRRCQQKAKSNRKPETYKIIELNLGFIATRKMLIALARKIESIKKCQRPRQESLQISKVTHLLLIDTFPGKVKRSSEKCIHGRHCT